MTGNYLQDVDDFLCKLGPAEQLLISRGKVGCNVCKFSVGRNFNTKAKLVVHFKSEEHWKYVDEIETKKGEHIKTVEERLHSVNEEVEKLEKDIALKQRQINDIDSETKKFKTWLMKSSVAEITNEIHRLSGKEPRKESEKQNFQCPECTFVSSKLKKFKKHLFGHKEASCQMLLLNLA